MCRIQNVNIPFLLLGDCLVVVSDCVQGSRYRIQDVNIPYLRLRRKKPQIQKKEEKILTTYTKTKNTETKNAERRKNLDS